jgi:hypothetical protein
MTMFEGVMDTRYIRLSSDNWMTIIDKDGDTINHHLGVSSMVVCGKIFHHQVFLITLDSRLIMVNLKNMSRIDENIMDLKAPNIISMDIILGSTPIGYKIVVISNTHMYLYDLDIYTKKLIPLTTFKKPRMVKVRWVDMDTLVIIRSESMELYSLSVGIIDKFKISFGDFVSTVSYQNPYLLLDGGRGLLVIRMIEK